MRKHATASRARETYAPPAFDAVSRANHVRLVADAIPATADLGDEGDTLRALYAQGFSFADVDDVLEEAIEAARVARARESIALVISVPATIAAAWFWLIALAPTRAMAETRDLRAAPHDHTVLAYAVLGVVILALVGLMVTALVANSRRWPGDRW